MRTESSRYGDTRSPLLFKLDGSDAKETEPTVVVSMDPPPGDDDEAATLPQAIPYYPSAVFSAADEARMHRLEPDTLPASVLEEPASLVTSPSPNTGVTKRKTRSVVIPSSVSVRRGSRVNVSSALVACAVITSAFALAIPLHRSFSQPAVNAQAPLPMPLPRATEAPANRDAVGSNELETVEVPAELPAAAPAVSRPPTAAARPEQTGGAPLPVPMSFDAKATARAAAKARDRGDLDAALSLFEQVAAHDPSDSEALTAMGNVALARHRADLATRSFRGAIAHNPDYLPAQIGLHDALAIAGDADAADRLCTRITDAFPAELVPDRIKRCAGRTATP